MSAGLLLSAAGCTRQAVENIRPEINKDQRMITSPDAYEAGYSLTTSVGTELEDDERLSGTEVPSPGYGGDDSTPSVDLSFYSPIPYDVVSSSDYSAYLTKHVKEPVVEALNAVKSSKDSDIYNKVYFRLYHFGHNLAPEGSEEALEKSAVTSTRLPAGGGPYMLGGKQLSVMMYDYVVKRYQNYLIKEQAVERLERSVSSVENTLTYEAAKSDERLPSSLVSLWGYANEQEGVDTLGQYLALARNKPYLYVPNLKFKIALGVSGSISSTFNPVATTGGRLPYQGGMQRSELESIFTSTNQVADVDGEVCLEKNSYDDSSICWCYVDNYSVTFIIVACAPENKLESLLGTTQYSAIRGAIMTTSSWDDVSTITSELGEGASPVIIKSGLRG